jgi:hypothetical protein
VGAVAVLVGVLPAGFGMPWWLVLPLVAALLIVGLRLFGEHAEDAPRPPRTTANR